MPEIEARMGLQSGDLVSVLPQLEPQPLGIYGLYQSRDHQHAALGLFLDALKQHLAAGLWSVPPSTAYVLCPDPGR